MSHERRSRKPTLHERLDHLFLLSWRRHEKLKERLRKIMTTMENMEAAVTRIEGVQASVVKLLGDLSDEIRTITNNPAAQVLADRVNASADALAAAVEANPDPTPNEPPAEPTP